MTDHLSTHNACCYPSVQTFVLGAKKMPQCNGSFEHPQQISQFVNKITIFLLRSLYMLCIEVNRPVFYIYKSNNYKLAISIFLDACCETPCILHEGNMVSEKNIAQIGMRGGTAYLSQYLSF